MNKNKEFNKIRILYLIGIVLATTIFLLVVKVALVSLIIAIVVLVIFQLSFSSNLYKAVQTDFNFERYDNQSKINAWEHEARSHGSESIYWRNKFHDLEKQVKNADQLEDLHLLMKQDSERYPY